jgi:hypothetical protein
VVLVAASLTPHPASAAGGTSIATAPTITPGTLQAGGGQSQEFWRMQLFASDRLTVRSDNSATDRDSLNGGTSFELYEPSVDDYRLPAAQPLNGDHNALVKDGMAEFSLTAPFTGLGIIDVCFSTRNNACPMAGSPPAPAFSFTVAVTHLAALTIGPLPSVRKRGAKLRLTAHVQSPAGTPSGACEFRPVGGHGATGAGPVETHDGTCAATVGVGHGGKVRYRARFTGDDGWSNDAALTRRIRVAK